MRFFPPEIGAFIIHFYFYSIIKILREPSGEMKAQRRPHVLAGDPDKKKVNDGKIDFFLFHGERMPALLEVLEHQFFYR